MGHWWLLVSNPATHLPRHQLTRRDAGHSPKMLCPKLVSAPCLVLFVVQIFFSIWAGVMTHENRSNVQSFYKWREFRPQMVLVNSRSERRQSEFYIFAKRVWLYLLFRYGNLFDDYFTSNKWTFNMLFGRLTNY